MSRGGFNFLSGLVHLAILAYLLTCFYTEKRAALQGSALFFAEGETGSYYEPMVRLAEEGSYSWTTSIDRYGHEAVVPSTRRTPGLLPLYFPLHRLVGEAMAKDSMVFIQIMLYLISTYTLAKSAELLLKDSLAYHAMHIISWLFWFNKPFVFLGVPESLSNSMLIFSFYFLVRIFRGEKFYVNTVFFSFFSTWAVMLRPALLTWTIAVSLLVAMLFLLQKWNWRTTLHFTLIGVLPVVFCTLAWSYRNYGINKTFRPEDNIFRSSPGIYTPSVRSIFELIKTWGGVVQRWVPGSEGAWFFAEGQMEFKSHYFFASFDQSHFEHIKSLYRESQTLVPAERLDEIDVEINTMVSAYIEAYRREYPLRYYVLNPLRATGLFLHLKTYTYLPFPSLDNMDVIQKIIKLLQVVLVYALYGLSLISLPWFWRKGRRNPELLLPVAFILIYLLILGGIMGANEPRYLVPVFPFMLILAMVSVTRLLSAFGIMKGRQPLFTD